MQKQNIILVAIVSFIVGAFITYLFAYPHNKNMDGMHGAPNGHIMSGSKEMMNMKDMMAYMNAELEGKTGDAFDKAFIAEMIVHHEGAVEMAKLALANASHQEIKNLAQAIITAQNKEINDMKGWFKKWYGTEYSSTLNSAEGAPTGSIHNMPVPPGVGAARAMLAQVLKIQENKVVILSAYEKQWSDSCLGLGGPAEICAAVITPGYEVTLQAHGKTYVYRTNTAGTSVREQK